VEPTELRKKGGKEEGEKAPAFASCDYALREGGEGKKKGEILQRSVWTRRKEREREGGGRKRKNVLTLHSVKKMRIVPRGKKTRTWSFSTVTEKREGEEGAGPNR